MNLQRVAVEREQTRPAVGIGIRAVLAEHAPARRPSSGTAVGQLLDIVAVGHAIVAQHVAVVPQALDDGG